MAEVYRPACLPDDPGVPSAPKSSSGWYLPSSRQYYDLIITFYGIRLFIEEAGGTYFKDGVDAEYWSATQSNPNGGQVWGGQYNRVDVGNITKMHNSKFKIQNS